MRIGYLWRGFLGDVKLDEDGKEMSTPDGNATYSWSIVWECIQRGYTVVPLGQNLDAPAAERLGEGLFSAFSQKKRAKCYEHLTLRGWDKMSDVKFPELDLLLVEWRWPIPGRNTPEDRGKPWYQNDLDRQNQVLDHYADKGTRIVVWDLDHKLTDADIDSWSMSGVGFSIVETSVQPKSVLTRRVEPPFVTGDLLQHDIDERKPKWSLGYIGSRYERDACIDEWIAPIAPKNTHRVKFWGKWEPVDEVEKRWPGIKFGDRIGVRDFRHAYSSCAAVPLMAKESYRKSGFMTPRVWEALLFGSMPIGLKGHNGIEDYCELVADDAQHLLYVANDLRQMSPIRRRVWREQAAERIKFMDVRNFVNVLESLA